MKTANQLNKEILRTLQNAPRIALKALVEQQTDKADKEYIIKVARALQRSELNNEK